MNTMNLMISLSEIYPEVRADGTLQFEVAMQNLLNSSKPFRISEI